MSKKYQALSPDGFTIDFHKPFYRSIKQAREAIATFAQAYKQQGYYSQACYNGYTRRISVNEIPDYCDIITIIK